MLTELIGFLGLTRNLVGRMSELNKEYFETFIQPIWEAYEKIHNDYKTSFQQYAEMVSDENVSIETLLEKIRQDSIYTKDFRLELNHLVKNIPPTTFKTKERLVSDFVVSLADYFNQRSHLSETAHNEPININIENKVRIGAYIEISRKVTESNRERGQKIIEQILSSLQTYYGRVAGAYYLLKKDILS